MNRILQATNFAAAKHSQQRRKNAEGSPYINHPVEVAYHLSSVGGVTDEEVLIAALLHDTIEDTETTQDEIVTLFGDAVAELVVECTDDKSLPKMERKRLQIENAPHKSPSAKMIKIADKTCNLLSILSDPPEDWSLSRQCEYFVWAEKVVSGLLGHNAALDEVVVRILTEGLHKLREAEQAGGANALRPRLSLSVGQTVAAEPLSQDLGLTIGQSLETHMHEQSTPEKILQTGLAFWASKTLLSAIEIGVFSELSCGPEHFDSLSGRLGLHPRSARDFLDSLVALGFLTRNGDRYANTPETDLFLDREKPSYVGGILEMANHRLYPFWGHLTEALRTGAPQNEMRTGGPGLFETLYADPARLKEFLAAMTGISHGANMMIARAYPWANHRTFVDVGTAQGDLAAQIALANPHLRGIGFDLPEVAPVFEEYVAAVGAADRLTFQAGDFFKQDLPKTDVVLMGHILHDWDLPTKKMLIKKAFDAIPAGGALIVYEAIIDDDRSKNAFGLMMSLNMLIETPGGFDYTGADCAGWMKEAGFSATRLEPLVGPDSMVVGTK